ncbi:aldo/keto reductase [Carnobacterium gallinarum]|uniref:aldo/keto reductase n=1 Tax=Carnobacterium gallinarum TaxID=2749 RepID=UPI0005521181|nr:aldo/keto reductase [Carnobacterium gallinarum]
MNYRKFADTDIELSAIGLGSMGMSFSYGEGDDSESLATLNKALDLGINFWDTADIYGIGANEELVSKVLVPNRDKVFLATKFGFRPKDPSIGHIRNLAGDQMYIDGSPKHVKEAVEASLRRLGIDTIDLYYLHRVDPTIPIEETVGAMAELVKEGKVRYLGLSEASVDEVQRANKIHKISALQSEYSMLTREVEEQILPFTKEQNMAFIPFSPLARGLMTNNLKIEAINETDFRKNLPRMNGSYLENNQKLAAAIAEIAASKGITAAQLTLAWVLDQGSHIIPIPGTKRRIYLEENAKAVDVHLDSEERQLIKDLLTTYSNVGPRYATAESKFIKK